MASRQCSNGACSNKVDQKHLLSGQGSIIGRSKDGKVQSDEAFCSSECFRATRGKYANADMYSPDGEK